jgi:hypothetical protein
MRRESWEKSLPFLSGLTGARSIVLSAKIAPMLDGIQAKHH